VRAWRGLLWLVLLLSGGPAWATHIVGGELDLQYLQADSYQLSMNLYFDAVNGSPGALDGSLIAGIYDKATNRQMTTVLLPLVNDAYVNYSNPACTVGSLSTRQLLYRNTIQLPAATYNGTQGYYVAVERCCRNNVIFNIVSPGNAAQTFYLEFPAVVQGNHFAIRRPAFSRRWPTMHVWAKRSTTTLRAKTPTATRWCTTW
jgi:hypothetical protein